MNLFLKRMMTGYEKWVTYGNIVRKRLWSKRGEAAKTLALEQEGSAVHLVKLESNHLESCRRRCCVFGGNGKQSFKIVRKKSKNCLVLTLNFRI